MGAQVCLELSFLGVGFGQPLNQLRVALVEIGVRCHWIILSGRRGRPVDARAGPGLSAIAPVLPRASPMNHQRPVYVRDHLSGLLETAVAAFPAAVLRPPTRLTERPLPHPATHSPPARGDRNVTHVHVDPSYVTKALAPNRKGSLRTVSLRTPQRPSRM